jgi:hypothetical protein
MALGASGCGGDKLDDGQTETNIQKGIFEQFQVKLKIDCPDDRPIMKGDKFSCDASSPDADSVKVTATQVDSKGNVRWEPFIVPTKRYESTISQTIFQQSNVKVDVDCPDVVAIKKGYTFECKATERKTAETRTIKVTQTDDNGNVAYQT